MVAVARVLLNKHERRVVESHDSCPWSWTASGTGTERGSYERSCKDDNGDTDKIKQRGYKEPSCRPRPVSTLERFSWTVFDPQRRPRVSRHGTVTTKVNHDGERERQGNRALKYF